MIIFHDLHCLDYSSNPVAADDWRLAIYSFLHLDGTHLLGIAMLPVWIGRSQRTG
jgi:hypothetical protein